MRLTLLAVPVALFISVSGTALAQTSRPTPAGTPIENQASITYAEPNGQSRVVLSNLARSLVEQVYAISIKPDANNPSSPSTNFALPVDPSNDPLALPGATINLAYSLTNTGNGPDQVTVGVPQATSDDFDLENVRLYRDLNANGLLDPGEPEISGGFTLNAAERINLILVGRVPVGANNGWRALLDLEGHSSGGALDNNNLSRVRAVTDAILGLSKRAVGPDASDRIRYTLLGSNLGNRAAKSIPGVAVVDGVLLDGVLIADAIPAGTSLDLSQPVDAVSGLAGTRAVYFVGSDWTATPNASASRIGLLIPDAAPTTFTPQDMLGPGAAYRLEFSLRIANPRGGSSIANTATIRYRDQSNTDQTTTSNTTISLVPSRPGVMVGPFGQPTGLAGGSYSFTDPVTALAWAIDRSGDGANASDQQTIASSGTARIVSFKNTVRNTGNATDTVSIGVDFTDPRSKLPPGSAVQVLTADGITPVSSLSLEPGAEADVIVRVTLPSTITSTQTIELVLRATSGLEPGRSDLTRDLVTTVPPSTAFYEVWIGPQGQPTAPEYPNPADAQSVVGFEGSAVRFPHTVHNAGNVTDTLNLGLESGLPSGWRVRWLRPDGQALTDTDGDGQPDTGMIVSGANMDVLLEVIPLTGVSGDNAGAGWNLVARVRSGSKVTVLNRTLDTITRLRPASEAWTITKTVSATRVMQGTLLEYSFVLTNTSGVEQTDVVLDDVLSAHLGAPQKITSGEVQDALQASMYQVNASFEAATGRLRWQIPSLPAGARLVLGFQSRVADNAPDASLIENKGRVFSQQIPTEVASNTVQTDVVGAVLQLEKIALQPSVAIGSAIGFELRAKNASANAVLDDVVITDTMPDGLLYKPGSSQLAGSGMADPTVSLSNGRQVLTWRLGALGALEPGASLSLRFQAIATPNVPERMVNQATATARATDPSGAGNQIVVTSNAASASVKRSDGVFTRRSTILGRVYFDADEDGRFTPGRDEPLPGARVYASDGRFAITDKEGRYSFAELEPGLFVLRLDPLTVPFTPRTVPEDLGRPGTRWLRLEGPGLAMADFPLENPMAAATKARRTSLKRGPVGLEKSIQSGGAGYIVTLRLRLAVNVTSLSITDPLPTGDPNAERQGLEARAQDGRSLSLEPSRGAIRFGALEPGEYLIRYALLTVLPPEFALTDPDLEWDAPIEAAPVKVGPVKVGPVEGESR